MKRIQRQFAAVLSLVIVAIPLAAFMPWSGTGKQEGIPPSAAEATPLLSPSPLLTLAPETPEAELHRKQITDRLISVLNLVQL